jgi:hypothetical protein
MGLTRVAMHKRQHESGAVSLFLVIFAMLLITVVTLSFIRIMVSDQSQASVADLSQSALDSAQSGTEDAKRALIYYRTLCNNGDPSCASEANIINSDTCNAGLAGVVDGSAPNQEQLIQQSQSDSDPALNLNQAYTCVKMSLNTDDYLGTLAADTSKIIPLKGTSDFDSVTIQWYLPSDLGTTATTLQKMVSDSATTKPLYLQTNWASNTPSLLRAQVMQFGSSFTLSDFDSSNTTNSDTNTLFLYPTGPTPAGSARTVNTTIAIAGQDIRKTATGSVQPVRCSGNLSGGGYACSVTLTLPEAVGETDTTRTAYLRLTPFYNATHFRVTLSDAATPVEFSAVQPSIDSTGRANNQYRRTETRVDLTNTNFAFPDAAVDISGNLCKDFVVTDDVNDYVNSCTP